MCPLYRQCTGYRYLLIGVSILISLGYGVMFSCLDSPHETKVFKIKTSSLVLKYYLCAADSDTKALRRQFFFHNVSFCLLY